MKQIQNITDEPIQRHTVLFDESEITLVLRFYPKTQHWAMNIEYKNRATNNVKLSISVLHMVSSNYPFDFIVDDASGNGIDPFKRDDFSNGRCRLYMLERDEMADIRGGAEVEL